MDMTQTATVGSTYPIQGPMMTEPVPIRPLDDIAASNGMTNLTDAMRDMDNLLWRMQAHLLRVEGFQHLAGDWRNAEVQFRAVVTKSKLAASSMTVLLSEYQTVILPALLSGKVPLAAIQLEVDLLARNVESRLEKLESRDESAMQDLCARITNLMTTTKQEVMNMSDKVKGDTNLIIEQLSDLEKNLKHWSTQLKTDLWGVCTTTATGAYTIALAAIGGPEALTDPETLVAIATSILAVGRSVMKLVGSHIQRRDLKHGFKAAQRLETHHAYRRGSLEVMQPDLGESEKLDPSFALRADMIIQLHVLLLNELHNLSLALAERAGSDACDLEYLKDNYQISDSCPVDSLVMMLDLYSKQALFLDRALVSVPNNPLVPPAEGRRKRVFNKIRGIAFQDILNIETPRTCRV